MGAAGAPAGHEGCSLVEVIATLGVLMIVMVAPLPQLVLGVSAIGAA